MDGAATLVDYIPPTDKPFNQSRCKHNNDTDNNYTAHFEGIDCAGNGVYQMPFTAASTEGDFAGTAYVKRLSNGRFSHDALWSILNAGSQGEIFSNDSCAGPGSTGLLNSGSTSDVDPFASVLNAQS